MRSAISALATCSITPSNVQYRRILHSVCTVVPIENLDVVRLCIRADKYFLDDTGALLHQLVYTYRPSYASFHATGKLKYMYIESSGSIMMYKTKQGKEDHILYMFAHFNSQTEQVSS